MDRGVVGSHCFSIWSIAFIIYYHYHYSKLDHSDVVILVFQMYKMLCWLAFGALEGDLQFVFPLPRGKMTQKRPLGLN